MNKSKQKTLLSVVLASFALLLSSCIKDEEANKECDILSAWVEGEEYASNFFQPIQMRVENISSNEKEIIFTVRSTISLPHDIPVNFTLTPGASIQPANGSKQDFTSGPVTYTVTSEDGAWTRKYKVYFREPSLPNNFGFEMVDEEEGYNKCVYNVFYEVDNVGNRQNVWASGNAGVTIINPNWTPDRFPTRSSDNGYKNKCVCLNTQYAGELGKSMKKPIAAGNLYLGKFNVNNVLFSPLKTTEFGIPIDKNPIRVTGYYKYQPGKDFTDAEMHVIPGRTDEASIYAVFYRNTDENGKEVMLYGDDVLTSPYLVKKAIATPLPPTNEWTRFEMFFEGDEPDEALVATRGYNLSVVFSSSKEGAAFEGAVGSTLYVDEVKIDFEGDEQ